MVDGQTPVSGLVARLSHGQDAVRSAPIERTVLEATGILYVDGTLQMTL